MTSFNHYAFGAIGDWLHRVLAGLAPDAPGYERIRIAPHPLEGFDFAAAEHLTPYGRARAAWTRDSGRIRIEATVPPNTTAVVELPDGQTVEVGSGAYEWEVDAEPASPPPSHVGLDSSLAAVIDDPEAYRLVVDVLEAGKPDAARTFRTTTQWKPGRDLGEAIFQQTGPELQRVVADRLAELSAARSGR
jgi:alpha-L-rhamnosidase